MPGTEVFDKAFCMGCESAMRCSVFLGAGKTRGLKYRFLIIEMLDDVPHYRVDQRTHLFGGGAGEKGAEQGVGVCKQGAVLLIDEWIAASVGRSPRQVQECGGSLLAFLAPFGQ